MQVPEIGKQSRKPRLGLPVILIALGIGLCVLLSFWAARNSSIALNPLSAVPGAGQAIGTGAEFPPQPELEPKAVVERQMAAIRAARDDATQIAACYAFASPSNRQAIGSAENLLNMIRANYAPMMNTDKAEVGEAQIEDRTAAVTVSVISSDAAVHAYQFFLSRQTEPPYTDCWMTDAVLELRTVAPPQNTEPAPSYELQSL